MPPTLSKIQALAPDAEQPVARNLRVLVVEDDPSSRRALTSLLKLNGFQVADVATAADAIACLSERPLCVLLDLMLPDGNGSAVLDHIRRLRLPIRVAVTSGAADWESMLQESRPDAYFGKPLQFDKIVRWLTSD